MKLYTKAPLPFQWNKRNFIKQFVQVLKDSGLDLEYWTFVDLFWGSGLLSHTIKRRYPHARVIYNDFDNYRERIAHMAETEELRKELYETFTSGRDVKAKIEEKSDIIEAVKRHKAKYGYIDMDTVSNWLLFSGNSAKSIEELERQQGYNCVPKNPILPASDYLEGLEIVSKDYQELIKENEGKSQTLYLFDPPYLNTDNWRYSIKDSRNLKDYLDIVKHLNGKKFIFFTSEKSSMREFIEWGNEQGFLNIKGYKILSRYNSSNHKSTYEDIMIYNI